MSFAKYLKELRTINKISTRELEKRSGVSAPYISQLQTGRNENPSIDVIVKLAKGLHVSPLDILVESGFITKDQIKEYIIENL